VQPELAQQGNIHIRRGIFGREQFVAVEDRIGTRKKAERLALARPSNDEGMTKSE